MSTTKFKKHDLQRRPQFDDLLSRRSVHRPQGGSAGFTMVEVALSLAIIGFALVAIIGILPAGLNVQKENREETIINQEASLWMDAIRQGAEGMDYLTNYVDAIRIRSTPLDTEGVPSGPVVVQRFTRLNSTLGPDYTLRNGFRIIGLLSTPKYQVLGNTVRSNHVVAYVRAISGAASEKAPQDNQIVQDGAFSYRLTAEVVPYFGNAGPWTNFSHFVTQTAGTNAPAARLLAANAHDVRLLFEWPLRPPFNYSLADPILPQKVGNSQLSFRQLMGGALEEGRPDPLTGVTNRWVFLRSGEYEGLRP